MAVPGRHTAHPQPKTQFRMLLYDNTMASRHSSGQKSCESPARTIEEIIRRQHDCPSRLSLARSIFKHKAVERDEAI